MEHRPVHMVLPSPVSWVPDVRPSSEEETPEKTPPGTAFRPDWETQFTEGKASEPPAEKKRPYCPWRSRLQECVRPDWCLTGLSSAIACSSELGPRPTRRRVWVRISKKLPRATAMRTLSEVRARIVWILKLFSERQR